MKIKVCEKCNKKYDNEYKSCPHCGSIKFVEYEDVEKTPKKLSAFCNKEYGLEYKSCPYCGSTKVIKEEKEEIVEEKEVIEEEINKEDIEYNASSKICDDCGNKYSFNLEKCPYCGSTKSSSLNLPSKKIYDGDKEFYKKNKNRKERNEYLKGFYIGSQSGLIEHSLLMEEKKLSENTRKGMHDGFIISLIVGGVLAVIILTVRLILYFVYGS